MPCFASVPSVCLHQLHPKGGRRARSRRVCACVRGPVCARAGHNIGMDRHAQWAADKIHFRVGYAAATATSRWLAAAPTNSPPAHWKITRAAQICDYEALANGIGKRVYRAHTLADKQPVIVKFSDRVRNVDDYSAYPGFKYRNDWANELMYLEYLRGQPGVPHLMGGLPTCLPEEHTRRTATSHK